MQRFLRIADAIDRFQDRIGKWLYWLTLLMVVVGGFNAVVRYMDKFTGMSLSSNLYLELQWYLFSLLFLLGAAYTLRHNAHVRVDIVYTNLSLKGRAWVDLLGTLIFLFPFCVLMLWVSWPAVMNSWEVLEMSPDPGGLPRYPIKTAIPVAFMLVFIQGVSMMIRSLAVLLSVSDELGPEGGRGAGIARIQTEEGS
ncbi:MAG: TRAP transporter small permease subunit [Bacteroidetes bacterium]|nr:TRAP transporter small permease subunit [Bacteroidota bacterium]MDA1333048.1 TRAP transporter small permease subunit [Bacteroidota bacterium]